MINSHLDGVAAQGAQPHKGFLNPVCKAFFLLFCTLLIGFSEGNLTFSQATKIHWQKETGYDLGYQIVSADTILMPGDSFSVNLHLKSKGSTKCNGAIFDLRVHSGISSQTQLISIPSVSWIGLKAEMQAGQMYKSDPDSLSFNINRTDEINKSGSGCVITLQLKLDSISIPCSQVIQSIGGNIIVSDNIDLSPEESPSWEEGEKPVWVSLKDQMANQIPALSVFPNPFSDWISILSSTHDLYKVNIYNHLGKWMGNGQIGPGEKLDTAKLSKGTYVLELMDSNKTSIKKVKMIKR